MLLVNKICFTVSIVSIVSATAVSILGIWGFVADQTLMWRALATLGVLFLASILTVMVNGFFVDRRGRSNS